MAKSIIFTAKLEKSPSKGGWHYVRLTDELRMELAALSGKNGNVPVLVTIGKTTYSSTTMSMGQQHWFIAMNAVVRKAESVVEGDVISVAITPDTKRL